MEEITNWICTPPVGVDMVFWACALISTLIFAIMTILSFLGMEGHEALSADFDSGDADFGDHIPLFSVHSLINFVLGFGWTGVVAADTIENKTVLYLVAVIVGLVFAYIYIFLRKQLMKLESNGAYNIKECVGSLADVYLRIPAKGEGKGKVQVSISGSIHELDAVSNGEAIPTGAHVTILEVNGNVLTVVKK